MICREAAIEISKLKQALDDMNVRLIGVGFEADDKAVQDFLLYPLYNSYAFHSASSQVVIFLNVPLQNAFRIKSRLEIVYTSK